MGIHWLPITYFQLSKLPELNELNDPNTMIQTCDYKKHDDILELDQPYGQIIIGRNSRELSSKRFL
jgi:hypothetical protein